MPPLSQVIAVLRVGGVSWCNFIIIQSSGHARSPGISEGLKGVKGSINGIKYKCSVPIQMVDLKGIRPRKKDKINLVIQSTT